MAPRSYISSMGNLKGHIFGMLFVIKLITKKLHLLYTFFHVLNVISSF